MTTTISLSTARIIDQIAALSAFRKLLDEKTNPEQQLSADNSRGLLPLISSATATVATRLAPIVSVETAIDSLPDSASDLIKLNIEMSSLLPAATATMVRKSIEEAIVYRVLSTIWLPVDVNISNCYNIRADSAVENTHDLFAEANVKATKLLRIAPNY